ncbi:hypothetical protein DL769_008766 [Monosporascus sp. CRB-8-3]|nr:hypothetical protein DL769_008766 [Monosporascus sp. CRB-8-3]
MTEVKTDHGAVWRREWAHTQKIKGPSLKGGSVFYRNIEEELDLARQTGLCFPIHLPSHTMDFSTCDVLAMGHSGALREEFLKELKANPGFHIGAGGSRLLDGTSRYQDMFEREMAELMGVESALIVHSGWTANQAIFSTVPRSGDVIVYDELLHATALAGIKVSLALEQKPFRHNDVEHFIEVMEAVKESTPLVKAGKRCVIIGVESFYSMDGDICPLRQLIEAAKEIFPFGNAQFIVDEAHSFGVTGPDGLGFVKDQGLEDEVAIRMITFGKALSGSGGKGSHAREYLQYLTKFYLDTLTSNPVFKKANTKGLLKIPVHEDGDWHEVPITHIVPLWTPRPKHALYLSFHLTRDGINGCHIIFPIVGKGEDRVRLVMHAHNTEEDVRRLVSSICSWAQEMLEIEASGDRNRLPSAARIAYDLLEKDRQGAKLTTTVSEIGTTKGSKVVHELKRNGETKAINGAKVVVETNMITDITDVY